MNSAVTKSLIVALAVSAFIWVVYLARYTSGCDALALEQAQGRDGLSRAFGQVYSRKLLPRLRDGVGAAAAASQGGADADGDAIKAQLTSRQGGAAQPGGGPAASPRWSVPVHAFKAALWWAQRPKVVPFQATAEADDAPGNDPLAFSRRQAVRAAMRHAWAGYTDRAWGHDELRAHQLTGSDDYGGIGATIFDAADTLLLMGLGDEAQRAAQHVPGAVFANLDAKISVFETNIRLIGGALALYELSGNTTALRKAAEIADKLRGAFDTPSGIPLSLYSIRVGKYLRHGWIRGAILSDAGTLSMEWWKLSQHTGDASYDFLAQKPMEVFRQFVAQTGRGLLPITWSSKGAPATMDVSMGAFGDSFYEYLLKFWILTGKSQDVYRSMWELAMDEMLSSLVHTSVSGLTFVGTGQYGAEDRVSRSTRMEHLTCFAGGMLALGVHHGAVDGDKATSYLQVAVELARTCYQMYHIQPTGLSADEYDFSSSPPRVTDPWWSMRPETAETLFVLYRVTGNSTYREWGWDIFESIEKNSKGPVGYHPVEVTRCPRCSQSGAAAQSSIQDSRTQNATDAAASLPDDADAERDKQCTYFLSETLKYLFLLFAPPEYLSLDEWVFNTEGHPLRISSGSGDWGLRLQPARAVSD